MKPFIMQFLWETVAHILLKGFLSHKLRYFPHVGLLLDNYYTCTSFCVIQEKQLIAEPHSQVVSTDIVRMRRCFVSPEALIPHYHNIFQIIGVIEHNSCSNTISNMIRFKSLSWEEQQTEIPDVSKESSHWQRNGRCIVTRLAEKPKSN